MSQAASSRLKVVLQREYATAAGTAATPTAASTTAPDGLLLLRVRAANSSGWDRTADDAGDGDQGQDVRQRLEEHLGGIRIRCEAERQRGRRAEEDRRRVGAERPPVAEDDCGERDEAAAGRHVLLERADVADRQIGTAERREDAGDDDCDVP